MAKFEDEHLDVLQNIEFGIVAAYREHPRMSDYDVKRMLEALLDAYKGERIGRPAREFPLSDVERRLLEAVRTMCEWRLGRAGPPGGLAGAQDRAPEPVTVDEIILCLKRVLKSVRRWNKDGGSQGYLNFVIQFMP